MAYTVDVELIAASAAPAAAMRARVVAAIKAPLRQCPLNLSPAPPDEGRQAIVGRDPPGFFLSCPQRRVPWVIECTTVETHRDVPADSP
jgi:hypothetical protein